MTATQTTTPRITSFAPQFLVDDLARSITYYRRLGFTFGEPWQGFYAIGVRDGLERAHEEAPRNDAARLHHREQGDVHAAAGVDGIAGSDAECVANGIRIAAALPATPGRPK